MSDPAQAHKPATADTLTKQRKLDDGVATRPKRTYGPPSGPTGDEYVDHGAVCDQASGPGCLLERDQRLRLILMLHGRIGQATGNYNDALEKVRIDTLLAKDDADLSWVAMFVLDLATWHLGSMITASLTKLRKLESEHLEQLIGEEAFHQIADAPRDLGRRLSETFVAVSDTRIKDTVKKAADAGKKGLAAAARREKARAPGDKKAETLSFLEQLQSAASLSFQTIREHAPATMNDAELIALLESFDVRNHSVAAYQEAISAKLERFHDSGVTKIGSRYEERAIRVDDPISGDVIRDVRVVWLEFESGFPRKLAFQHWDGRYTPGIIHPEDPWWPTPKPRGFGPRDAVTPRPEPGISERDGTNFFVPDEFTDIALARHAQVWGGAPPVVYVDDSTWTWEPARARAAAERKRQKAPPPKPAMKAPTPAPQPIDIPDELKLRPQGTP